MNTQLIAGSPPPNAGMFATYLVNRSTMYSEESCVVDPGLAMVNTGTKAEHIEKNRRYIVRMYNNKTPISVIARSCGVSRPTIAKYLSIWGVR